MSSQSKLGEEHRKNVSGINKYSGKVQGYRILSAEKKVSKNAFLTNLFKEDLLCFSLSFIVLYSF